ncbi:hypothetical protein [Amycolatopsis minnesotensis]|uniref:hypothetical protein n=1 Tax=Amycolatopsis minnesotensis TaxID=337894 RepID=UPI0031CE89BA
MSAAGQRRATLIYRDAEGAVVLVTPPGESARYSPDQAKSAGEALIEHAAAITRGKRRPVIARRGIAAMRPSSPPTT